MLKSLKFGVICFFLLSSLLSAVNIRINELMPKNANTLYNNDYRTHDWIELYNPSKKSVNINKYRISDKNDYDKAFVLPDTIIAGMSFLHLYASDLNTVSTNAFTIESSGYGINQSVLLAGFRFDYIKVSGNFEIYVEVSSIEPFEKGFPHCGLLVTEKLDDKSPFVALYYQNMNYENFYWHCYRDSFNVTPKYKYPNFNNPNRTGFLRMKRVGDTVYTFCEDGEGYVFQSHSNYFPVKNVYIGLATASSDKDRLVKFSFRNLKINGQKYDFTKLMIFEKNIDIPGRRYHSQEIHSNFKLSDEGETVYLWNTDGDLIDSLKFPKLSPDVSIGRYPDGSDSLFYFKKGTPSKSNNIQEFYYGITAAPSFSILQSWHNDKIKIRIENKDSSSIIYYTLDGSIPVKNSEPYNNENIEIDKNTVIRAIAFKENNLPSEITTRTFFINESSSLPVVSISCESSELTNEDKTGMFDNRFENIKSQINFEYYDKNKNLVFNSPVEMRIFGHGVARGWSQPSLRLDSRKYLGSTDFNYKFFGANSLPEYETLRLRNSSGDWTHSFNRDVFISQLAKQIPSQLSAAFQPVLSFINGEFFGLYNLREHINESYLAAKYKIPEDSVNIIRNFEEVTAGSVKPLFTFFDYLLKSDIEDTNVIKEIRKNIDLDNLFDYTILSLYSSNYDWPFNNLIAWQSRSYDSLWRFICNDFDWSFGLDNYVTHPENDCVFRFFSHKDSTGWLFAKIVSKILENNDYRNKFLNRTADLLNSAFLPEPVKTLIDSIHNLIADEVPRQRAKHPDCMEYLEESYSNMLNFAERRPEFLRQHLVEQFNLSGTAKLIISSNKKNVKIQINSLAFDLNQPFEGIYFKDVPLDIKIIYPENYEFLGWSIKDLPKTNNLQLVLDDSTDLEAFFRIDGAFQPVLINEIMYKPAKEKDCRDWFELYNPNNKEENLSDYVFKDDNNSHIFKFPSNSLIPPQGYLVVSENPDEFKKIYPDVNNVIGGFDFGLGTNDQIRIYDSFGFLVDSVAYKSDSPWPLGANGTGFSIELVNPFLDNNIGENWKVTKIPLGTPGRINTNFTAVETISFIDNKQYQIYPNPASEYLTISFGEDILNSFHLGNNINIKIYNNLGECILSNNQQFKNFIRIDISKLNRGIYFIYFEGMSATFVKI